MAAPAPSQRPHPGFFQRIANWFVNAGGWLIGHLELLIGCFYSVSSYRERVSDGLWRGSRVDSLEAMQELKNLGIKTVIDLREEGSGDASYAKQAGLREFRLPLTDDVAPTMADVRTFLDYVMKPENQPAYVHCEAGKGRTGIMCAAYRMAVQGWTADQAAAEANKYGMGIPAQFDFIYDIADALSLPRTTAHAA